MATRSDTSAACCRSHVVGGLEGITVHQTYACEHTPIPQSSTTSSSLVEDAVLGDGERGVNLIASYCAEDVGRRAIGKRTSRTRGGGRELRCELSLQCRITRGFGVSTSTDTVITKQADVLNPLECVNQVVHTSGSDYPQRREPVLTNLSELSHPLNGELLHVWSPGE